MKEELSCGPVRVLILVTERVQLKLQQLNRVWLQYTCGQSAKANKSWEAEQHEAVSKAEGWGWIWTHTGAGKKRKNWQQQIAPLAKEVGAAGIGLQDSVPSKIMEDWCQMGKNKI